MRHGLPKMGRRVLLQRRMPERQEARRGVYWSPDGLSNEGQFSHDWMHGEGNYRFADRRAYVGQWRDGELSGRGKMSWPSGAAYQGGYQRGVKHGTGLAVDAKGSVTRGVWNMGELIKSTAEVAGGSRRELWGDEFEESALDSDAASDLSEAEFADGRGGCSCSRPRCNEY